MRFFSSRAGLTAATILLFGLADLSANTPVVPAAQNPVTAATTPTSAPSAPTQLSGTLNADNAAYVGATLNLTWQGSPGAKHYIVDRQDVASGVWTTAYATVGLSCSYSETAGGENVYRVSASNDSGTSAASDIYPQTRYAVIDLGAGQLPIKITNSGYVLMSKLNGTTPETVTTTCFANGTSYSFGPKTSGDLFAVKDITEDGMCVGEESNLTTNSSTQPLVRTGVETWTLPGSGTTMTAGTPDYTAGYGDAGSNGTPLGAVFPEFFTGDGRFADASAFSSDPDTHYIFATGDYIDSAHDIWSYRFVTALPDEILADEYEGSTPLGTAAPRSPNIDLPTGIQVEIIAVSPSGKALWISDDFTGSTYFQPTAVTYSMHDSSLGSPYALSFLPFGLNSDGVVVGADGTHGVWWSNATGKQPFYGGTGYAAVINKAMQGSNYAYQALGAFLSPPAYPTIHYGSIDNYLIWEMNPTSSLGDSTHPATFKSPMRLGALLSPGCGWSNVNMMSLNDGGAMVGVADYSGSDTSIASGSHGVMLLPVAITPSIIPTSGVARAKLVFGSGVQVPRVPQSNTTFAITVGGQNCTDIHQDDNNPNIFYFTAPPGTTGSADVAISGISVPGMPWLSATPPQTMTLPSLVQYTDDNVKGMQGFSDSNCVSIEEGKSVVDYQIQQGNITSDQATGVLSDIRDDYASTQQTLYDQFYTTLTPDPGALSALQQKSEQKLGDFFSVYPPPSESSGGGTGVTIVASVPDAYETGPTSGLFTVTRPAASTSSLTVNYTIGGTATNGTDYTTLSGSVVIAANQTTAQITVAPIQHALGANKTVLLTLSSGTGYTIDSNYNADTVTIYDYGNGITSTKALKKNRSLVVFSRTPQSPSYNPIPSHFFVNSGIHHVMSINPSALAALMLGQTTPSVPQLGSSTFFSDVQARLTATGSTMAWGKQFVSDYPITTSGWVDYFVFDGNKYHMDSYATTAVGNVINQAVADNSSASLIINGALCNYHCANTFLGAPAFWKDTSNPEPFQTIGVVIHSGSILPTSSNSSKKSWTQASSRYWFGESTAANGTNAASYQFGGKGNPTASATPEAIGGLISCIVSDHSQTTSDDKDLSTYSAFRCGHLVGFNIIGVNRATGMIIVVTKKNLFGAPMFNVQALLRSSGVDDALLTDGGGSVGCWSKAKGYIALAKRQIPPVDANNTVTTYFIFSPNP